MWSRRQVLRPWQRALFLPAKPNAFGDVSHIARMHKTHVLAQVYGSGLDYLSQTTVTFGREVFRSARQSEGAKECFLAIENGHGENSQIETATADRHRPAALAHQIKVFIIAMPAVRSQHLQRSTIDQGVSCPLANRNTVLRSVLSKQADRPPILPYAKKGGIFRVGEASQMGPDQVFNVDLSPPWRSEPR